MNTRDPRTWTDLSAHPACVGGAFDEAWYDGDLSSDLKMLRDLAFELTTAFSDPVTELMVLDDLTLFVRFSTGSLTADIFPAADDAGRRCFYIDDRRSTDELRLATTTEVVRHLRSVWRSPG